MSYTVSGLVRDFTAEGYDSKKHLIVSFFQLTRILIPKIFIVSIYLSLDN